MVGNVGSGEGLEGGGEDGGGWEGGGWEGGGELGGGSLGGGVLGGGSLGGGCAGGFPPLANRWPAGMEVKVGFGLAGSKGGHVRLPNQAGLAER